MPTTNSLAVSNETPRSGHGAQGLGSSDVHFDDRLQSFWSPMPGLTDRPVIGVAPHSDIVAEIPITLVGNRSDGVGGFGRDRQTDCPFQRS
jgi:hypothetical protein